MKEKVKGREIESMLEVTQSMSKDYNPKILYCLVDKKISHRLFDLIITIQDLEQSQTLVQLRKMETTSLIS